MWLNLYYDWPLHLLPITWSSLMEWYMHSFQISEKISSVFVVCLALGHISHFWHILRGCRGSWFPFCRILLLQCECFLMFLQSALLLVCGLNYVSFQRKQKGTCLMIFLLLPVRILQHPLCNRVYISNIKQMGRYFQRPASWDENQLTVCQTQHIFIIGTNTYMFWLNR